MDATWRPIIIRRKLAKIDKEFSMLSFFVVNLLLPGDPETIALATPSGRLAVALQGPIGLLAPQ
jgi:hypothetical protein